MTWLRQTRPYAIITILLFTGPMAPARGDTVQMKNGDRITGKIISADGGKLVVTPDFDKGAKLVIKQADVATFASPTKMVIKLASGAMMTRSVEPGPTGEVYAVMPGATLPQMIALPSIAKINPNNAWNGTVGLNASYDRAVNTIYTAGLTADAMRRTDDDRITASAEYNYGEQTAGGQQTTSANNWFLQGKYDYFVSPRWFAYATSRFEGDQVNHLIFRTTPGVGMGYQWVDAPDFHFDTEGGLTYLYQHYDNEPMATNQVAVRLGYHADISWDADRIKLFNDVTLLPTVGSGTSFLALADAGLRVAIAKDLYTELKANMQYDDHPPPGSRNMTDQMLLSVGFTY